jgi:hypothetical protein
MSKALADLKADLARSLAIRVDLMVEDALAAESDAAAAGGAGPGTPPAPAHPLLAAAGGGAAAAACVGLPRRVLLPWQAGLQVCDHLAAGEGAADAADRARELLGVDLGEAADAVVEVEGPAALTDKPRGGVQGRPVGGGKAGGSVGAGGGVCGGSLAAGAAAAAVAVAAAALGYLSLSSS